MYVLKLARSLSEERLPRRIFFYYQKSGLILNKLCVCLRKGVAVGNWEIVPTFTSTPSELSSLANRSRHASWKWVSWRHRSGMIPKNKMEDEVVLVSRLKRMFCFLSSCWNSDGQIWKLCLLANYGKLWNPSSAHLSSILLKSEEASRDIAHQWWNRLRLKMDSGALDGRPGQEPDYWQIWSSALKTRLFMFSSFKFAARAKLCLADL